MTQSRRRFLTITAACAAAPLFAQTVERWHGTALGAQIEITLHGTPEQTSAALRAARTVIGQIEARFNLYNPTSELSRLNTTGTLSPPSKMMRDLLAICDENHRLTDGLFDPSIQPLWTAMAAGTPAPPLPDWGDIQVSAHRLTLAFGQQLTFNGIAQGFATDRVRDALVAHGLTEALVNIGEFAAIGGPFTVGVHDPIHRMIGHRTLTGMAIATSSPAAMALPNGRTHIINPLAPDAPPRWTPVSIESRFATQADALSTALVHGDIAMARRLRHLPDIKRITLVDDRGDVTTL